EFYGRSSDIIYPPVDTGEHLVSREDRGYYLVVSALVPYKRVDLAVKAFTGNGRRLVVIGEGNVSEDVRQGAGPNVEFLGWTDDTKLREYYSLATALIFPGEEDFGIVPLEAQAHGKPVIAYGKGGALETVVPLEGQGSCVKGHGGGATGVYFPEQTVEALNKAVEEFEMNRDKFDPDVIRANALRFGRDRYRNEIREYIESKLEIVV
ncbi:MAG: glycosyltransferase, partial [Candidatus Omnitrophica bacterium]|nr:glycosyltransferase [Candidatus Omnitrophota bacterium]